MAGQISLEINPSETPVSIECHRYALITYSDGHPINKHINVRVQIFSLCKVNPSLTFVNRICFGCTFRINMAAGVAIFMSLVFGSLIGRQSNADTWPPINLPINQDSLQSLNNYKTIKLSHWTVKSKPTSAGWRGIKWGGGKSAICLVPFHSELFLFPLGHPTAAQSTRFRSIVRALYKIILYLFFSTNRNILKSFKNLTFSNTSH